MLKRTISAAIMVVLLCTLALTAGCTSNPTLPAVPPLPAVPLPGSADQSWTGSWNTSWATLTGNETRMTLVQNNASVSGTYAYARGKIRGTVEGNRLIGTWSEGDGDADNSGPLEFIMSADGKSFTGKWAYTSDGENALQESGSFWNGKRYDPGIILPFV
jgi:hypothetical protein